MLFGHLNFFSDKLLLKKLLCLSGFFFYQFHSVTRSLASSMLQVLEQALLYRCIKYNPCLKGILNVEGEKEKCNAIRSMMETEMVFR